MSAKILVADDDPVQRRLLEAMVRRFGYEPLVVDGGAAALRAVEAGGIDLLVLDLKMPDVDGLAVLAALAEREERPPVIVQTAHGSIDAVVAAMRAGAADFVVKPVSPERLNISIRNALAAGALEGEVRRITRRQAATLTFADLGSRSPAMAEAVRLGQRAASSTIPVLIEGESGAGKEVFARAIAGAGSRAGKPFVAVNCGAIPPNLVESILFGHEKGAFTGATERHVGKFVEADGGTLFLDEIGELPLDAQVKLLRAIQEGVVDPVGAKKPLKVDIRLVSASNRSLQSLVAEGKFREDLFYRLDVFPLTVPPLRERRADIAGLARRFLARFAAEEGRRIRAISPAALALLESQPWPGNVRQLENAVFRAVVLAESEELQPEDFPQLRPPPRGLEPPAEAAGPLVHVPSTANPPGSPTGISQGPPAADAVPLVDAAGQVRPIAELEADAIRFAIERCGGQMTEVARRLGIGRSTLYRRLRELGLGVHCGGDDTPDSEAAA
jgi:DNA-binding NtrC family response regulator